MCRHIYYWKIVDCDVKQQIHLNSPHKYRMNFRNVLDLLILNSFQLISFNTITRLDKMQELL